jgi:signal transduction histidine kinase
VRLPRIFSTTSFKLAALFALVFGFSSIAVGAFVYVNVKTALSDQQRTRIQADALALKGEYDSGGMSDMMAAIHERQHNNIAGGLDYSLFQSDGKRIFGNMPRQALKPGWKHLLGPPDGDEPPGQLERLLVFRQPLSPDLWLVVGDDVGRLHQLSDSFLRVFGIGLLLTLTLAAGGGAAVSIAFLQRIDSITRTAEAIIEGDIGQRISLSGSGDDLDRLANTLNRMLDRIGLLMETLRHVSTDIAHDLRTPLGHLRHALDDARERANDVGEYKAAVERAVNETDAILETFSAILRIAQIESGSRRAGFRRIDLSAIASDVAQSFKPTAEEQNHKLNSEIESGLQIVGDRELTTQLMANLIDNAIRHTPGGTAIWLRLAAKRDTVLLEVCDNGMGVPQDERGKIFHRFYRGEASRTTPGNGLGLSLVSAVAGLHRATIAVLDNQPGLKIQIEFPYGVGDVS